jgi:cytochrome oxidase Cu insertion factor (SCO1/SenC/PrrC family)
MTLKSVDGGQYNLIKDDPDKYKLIYFGYSNCPDVCPTTLSNLTRALYGGKIDKKRADKFQIIFITIDPKRDTQERLREWLPIFSDKIHGLIPTTEQIDEIKSQWHIAIYPNNNPNSMYEKHDMNDMSHHAKDASIANTRGDLVHSSYIFVSKGDKIVDVLSDNNTDSYIKHINSAKFK